MPTKSEYYTLLLRHLQLDDSSRALTRNLHEYLNKFKILKEEEEEKEEEKEKEEK
jgi:hypothetical protein